MKGTAGRVVSLCDIHSGQRGVDQYIGTSGTATVTLGPAYACWTATCEENMSAFCPVFYFVPHPLLLLPRAALPVLDFPSPGFS